MKVFLIAFLSLLFLGSYAQGVENKNNSSSGSEHYLGISAGTLNGIGYSYKYQMGKLGIQLTALPPVGENYVSSYGVSTHYRLHNANYSNLFVQAGFNANNYSWSNNQSAGLGLGLEFNRNEICFSVAINYQVYNIDKDPFPFLGADLGLFYHF